MLLGTAQVVADHLAADAKVCAKMRAMRIDRMDRAIAPAPDDKFAAEVAQGPHIPRRDLG